MMASEHSSTAFAAELADIRHRFGLMASRTCQMVEQTCLALEEGDAAAARRVVDSDRFLDRLEVELDEKCLLALARYTPVASDLRLMVTILKAVTDLERIGDLCSSSALHLIHIVPFQPPGGADIFRKLITGTLEMVRLAERALQSADEDLALDILSREEQMDELWMQLLDLRITQRPEPSRQRETGLRMFLIAKNFERIADHCTNLAEQVIFLARSEDVRHGAGPSTNGTKKGR